MQESVRCHMHKFWYGLSTGGSGIHRMFSSEKVNEMYVVPYL